MCQPHIHRMPAKKSNKLFIQVLQHTWIIFNVRMKNGIMNNGLITLGPNIMRKTRREINNSIKISLFFTDKCEEIYSAQTGNNL